MTEPTLEDVLVKHQYEGVAQKNGQAGWRTWCSCEHSSEPLSSLLLPHEIQDYDDLDWHAGHVADVIRGHWHVVERIDPVERAHVAYGAGIRVLDYLGGEVDRSQMTVNPHVTAKRDGQYVDAPGVEYMRGTSGSLYGVDWARKYASALLAAADAAEAQS